MLLQALRLLAFPLSVLGVALTTLFGMLPLTMGIGEGSELMQPLAILMVGGLSLSALLTLFVVPNAYLLFNGWADRLKAWLSRERDRRPSAAP